MLHKNIIIITFIFLFIFIGNNCGLAASDDIWYTKSGYIASVSEELLDKAIGYVAVKDNAAFQKLLDTKSVFLLKGGLRVYEIERSFTGKIKLGKIKVRPVGETIELWTLYEALVH